METATGLAVPSMGSLVDVRPKPSESYLRFICEKSQTKHDRGFAPVNLPSYLFDFQHCLVDWSVRKGRALLSADTGLGKTGMQLAWADQVVRRTNRPVILATPLAVGPQTILEGEKFGIECKRSRDGRIDGTACVWVTNYEQLHKFDPHKFAGAVGDESSGIKNFKSARKEIVVEFMRHIPYGLLCTATAAPNDYWELGTSSEALGVLGFRDMITAFFKQETSKDRGWGRTKYRFRGHAEKPFWQWVCSWARAIRRPSDLGFDDSRFVLPELTQREIVVQSAKKRDGMLFNLPAMNLQEQREERRNTITERCDEALRIVEAHEGASVVWCDLNAEGDRLEKIIPGAVQVKGAMSDDAKEEVLLAFQRGEIERLITKPKIGCWGLNWQHCSNVVTFPTHSFEQHYQLVRRCWRFGQKDPVTVSAIVSEGERGVLDSISRKSRQCDEMFSSLCEFMHDSQALVKSDTFHETEAIPSWL